MLSEEMSIVIFIVIEMKNLRNTILVVFVALGTMVATAAGKSNASKSTVERPDMEQIKKEVQNPSGKYYYPKLMAKYEQNDTVMTLQDYRYLYLGYVFQEDYNPYRRSTHEYDVEELYYKKDLNRQELNRIIDCAELALQDDPFDLKQMNFLIYALQKSGKVNRARIWQFRLNHILEAILSTGTGLDADNAWIVIDPAHEYNILNFKNNLAEDVNFIAPYYDSIKLKVSEDDKNSVEGYYFNIRYILEEYNRKFPVTNDGE